MNKLKVIIISYNTISANFELMLLYTFYSTEEFFLT